MSLVLHTSCFWHSCDLLVSFVEKVPPPPALLCQAKHCFYKTEDPHYSSFQQSFPFLLPVWIWGSLCVLSPRKLSSHCALSLCVSRRLHLAVLCPTLVSPGPQNEQPALVSPDLSRTAKEVSLRALRPAPDVSH